MTTTLCKAERQNKRSIIGELFGSGGKSISAFPLRVVYKPIEKNNEYPVSILVSVPKRLFKRAVKRNRIKRQIREAYRLNKDILLHELGHQSYGMVIAFIWQDKEMHTSEEINFKIKNILLRIGKKIHQS